MHRPPQNLNLIDYALAEAERVYIGARFLLREHLQERVLVHQFVAFGIFAALAYLMTRAKSSPFNPKIADALWQKCRTPLFAKVDMRGQVWRWKVNGKWGISR